MLSFLSASRIQCFYMAFHTLLTDSHLLFSFPQPASLSKHPGFGLLSGNAFLSLEHWKAYSLWFSLTTRVLMAVLTLRLRGKDHRIHASKGLEEWKKGSARTFSDLLFDLIGLARASAFSLNGRYSFPLSHDRCFFPWTLSLYCARDSTPSLKEPVNRKAHSQLNQGAGKDQ